VRKTPHPPPFAPFYTDTYFTDLFDKAGSGQT